jgi:ubiquinone/menaquinone biosynthesis C-methylase UbiE
VERKRELMRLYDETVDFYERRYREIQLEKYEFARRYLLPCTTLLEVGCGMGFYLRELRKLAKLVVGVDFSEGMLRKVREGIVVLADAEHLPFRDNVFDQVLSITALQNFPNPVKALEEMRRVLHENGRLVISSLRKKHPLPLLMGLVERAGFRILEGIDEPRYEDTFVVATKSQLHKL